MKTVLKRGLKIFVVSSVLFVATIVLPHMYYTSVMVASDEAVLGSLSDNVIDDPDQSEPVTYYSETWYFAPGWIELLGLFLLYFALCTAFAWYWSRMKAMNSDE